MTDGSPARSDRWLWVWDGYLIVCLGVVAGLVIRAPSTGSAARAVAVTSLALMAVSWLAGGRRTARDDSAAEPMVAGARGYVVGVGALFVVAVTAAPVSAFALAALCPIAFLCLTLRPALIGVTVLNLVPVPVTILRAGQPDQVRAAAGIAVLGLVLTAFIGISIERITRQSAERSRLIAALEASQAEVAALSRQAGVAGERTRLAAEIHDTLAQGFTSLITLLQAAESEVDTDRAAADRHLALALRTARENLAEARAMVTVLAPADLRAGTLADVVARLVARLAEETGAATSCVVEGIPADLSTAVEVVLVRGLQESLANIRRHARATTVTVDLLGSPDAVTLTVTDDGVGFDPSVRPTDGGFGLPGIRARVEQVTGTLTVDSALGLGATLTLTVPA